MDGGGPSAAGASASAPDRACGEMAVWDAGRDEPDGPGRLYRLWVPVCAGAELLGIAAGALWWSAMDRLSPDPVLTGERILTLLLKALSGLPEGLVLGTLQALVLRRLYPALPVGSFVALTVAVAVLGWGLGSAVPIIASPQDGAAAVEPSLALVLLFASAFGLAVGGLFGAAQALALRRAARKAWWWIVANAAAWALALPAVYAAAGLFDEVPSAAAILVAGIGGGSAAGLVLGAITGLAFWRMAPLPPRAIPPLR